MEIPVEIGDVRSASIDPRFPNFLNKMDPGNPGQAITTRDFGTATGQRGNPRRIMMALTRRF